MFFWFPPAAVNQAAYRSLMQGVYGILRGIAQSHLPPTFELAVTECGNYRPE